MSRIISLPSAISNSETLPENGMRWRMQLVSSRSGFCCFGRFTARSWRLSNKASTRQDRGPRRMPQPPTTPRLPSGYASLIARRSCLAIVVAGSLPPRMQDGEGRCVVSRVRRSSLCKSASDHDRRIWSQPLVRASGCAAAKSDRKLSTRLMRRVTHPKPCDDGSQPDEGTVFNSICRSRTGISWRAPECRHPRFTFRECARSRFPTSFTRTVCRKNVPAEWWESFG